MQNKMNIEHLKDIWNQEKIEDTPEVSLEKQKQIRLPLDKIRRNMKIEFWMSAVTLPLMILFYIPRFFKDFYQSSVAILLLLITLIILGYYHVKFYTLYKKLNTQKFSTYHHLLDLRYELVLNTELYKSSYLSFAPIFLCFYAIIYPNHGNLFSLILMIFSCLISIIALYVMGRFWLQEMYGKHIQEISHLVAEFSDEEDDFKYNRSIISLKTNFKFLSQLRDFCDQKFGKYGGLVYGFVIGFLVFIFMMALGFVIGYLIGYMGVHYGWFDANDIEKIRQQ